MTIVNASFVNVIFFDDEIHIFETRSTMNTGRKNKWSPYKKFEDMNYHVLFSNSDGVSQCIDQIKRFDLMAVRKSFFENYMWDKFFGCNYCNL